MCVRISIFAIYRLDFGTVPIVWYFFFISLISILFYESRHYQISIYTIALHISWLNNYIILSTAPIRSATHTHICYLSVNGFNKLSLYSHGYVPLVVNTSRSFPHSWLITGFVTRLTRRVPVVEQELPTLPDPWVQSRFLVGFVLLDL